MLGSGDSSGDESDDGSSDDGSGDGSGDGAVRRTGNDGAALSLVGQQ